MNDYLQEDKIKEKKDLYILLNFKVKSELSIHA